MQNRLETQIEGDVADWAAEMGLLSLKLNVLGSRAWPDRHFIGLDGRSAFIEFKRPGEYPRPNQLLKLWELLDRGQYAVWTDNFSDAVSFLATTLLSEERNAHDDFSSVRRDVLGSWAREDYNLLGFLRDLKESKNLQEYARCCSASRMLQRLAEGGQKVARISAPKS